ncbi:MAG: hypothetical protein HYU66_19570 [Armatimonadetes bacterium]|nr:hypothetical protein [Armatimonadota bacterium]
MTLKKPLRTLCGVVAGALLLVSLACGRPTATAVPAPPRDAAPPAAARPAPEPRLEEHFDGPQLDPAKWAITRKNDFQESTIDIVGGRLRLRAATIGTDDKTVKFHGVRTVHPVSLKPPVEIGFTLDWNKQANGCYLSAGVFLCPTATDGNPRDEDTMLRFEYVGVPPGKNGRSWLWSRDQKLERLLFDEGWPKQHREGRAIGVQQVKLRWDGGRLTLVENGKELWSGPWKGFDPPQAYLYLQMSSHSNYPPRELFFDDVTVSPR